MANKIMIHMVRETDTMEDAVLIRDEKGFATIQAGKDEEFNDLLADGWMNAGIHHISFYSGSDILPNSIGVN